MSLYAWKTPNADCFCDLCDSYVMQFLYMLDLQKNSVTFYETQFPLELKLKHTGPFMFF